MCKYENKNNKYRKSHKQTYMKTHKYDMLHIVTRSAQNRQFERKHYSFVAFLLDIPLFCWALIMFSVNYTAHFIPYI